MKCNVDAATSLRLRHKVALCHSIQLHRYCLRCKPALQHRQCRHVNPETFRSWHEGAGEDNFFDRSPRAGSTAVTPAAGAGAGGAFDGDDFFNKLGESHTGNLRTAQSNMASDSGALDVRWLATVSALFCLLFFIC